VLTPKENSIRVLKHLLKETELDNNLIVALLANIAVETGYTFDFKTKQRGKRTDPAFGLFQFDPRGAGLASLFYHYLEYRKCSDSMEAQIDFIVDILLKAWKQGVSHVGGGNVDKVLEAAKLGPAQATEAFCSHILRPGKPHMDRRLAAVKMVQELMAEVVIA
jgi:hypothetical protein